MLSEPNISYKPFWGICRPLNSWRANSPNPIQIYCALKILDSICLKKIMTLTNGPFRKFALNLNMDGKLYIAAHSGHGFENASRDELKWFMDLMDVFRRK